MRRSDRVIVRRWPAGSDGALMALEARDDRLVAEEIESAPGVTPLVFGQSHGPFHRYQRTATVEANGDVVESITYRLRIPWFGWLFQFGVARTIFHRRVDSGHWWAPPDRLGERQVRTLALLASASAVAAFANTLFTQTASFAAERFDITATGQGVGGAIVRLGIVIALPFSLLADRAGRRRTLVLLAWLTPALCALGALAPSFWALVASQTVARPIGIALAVIAAVAAAEDMPRNSRAYALSVLAMSSGLGAGVAVGALRLADTGPNGWRWVYSLAVIWFPIAIVLMRDLLETRRFETVHRMSPPMPRSRFLLVAAVALTSNLFIAPASFFQNRYLGDIRGYSGGGIALFTFLTATPASIGLVLGGRLADTIGRRRLIAWCTPLSTGSLAIGYTFGGATMWAATFMGGLTAAMAYPAYAVYRTELFPTGNRGIANGLVTAVALLGGSIGIVLIGLFHDRGWSFGELIAIAGIGQLIAAFIAWRWFPETAHLELEQINPGDPVVSVN